MRVSGVCKERGIMLKRKRGMRKVARFREEGDVLEEEEMVGMDGAKIESS